MACVLLGVRRFEFKAGRERFSLERWKGFDGAPAWFSALAEARVLDLRKRLRVRLRLLVLYEAAGKVF